MLVGGVAAAAAVRTFPFRVFSFPKEIKVAADSGLFFETWDEWNKLAIYTNGLGNLGHPSALDVYLAEQRKAFPYADLRYVSVDGGTLPLGPLRLHQRRSHH
jgi:hypothetical protein